MTLIEALMKTGLTRHESELYVALSRDGESNGYEAAKNTGIPRANVYQALAGLVDKGGAAVITGDIQRYSATPVLEYCENVTRHMRDVTELIRRECPTRPPENDPYLTISGFNNISDKMRNMILHARERIYISATTEELKIVSDELEKLVARGLKAVVITNGDVELPGVTVHVIQKTQGQIRLISDSSQVLTGTLTGSDSDVCLYSKNQPLIQLVKDSLSNEIKLATIAKQTAG